MTNVMTWENIHNHGHNERALRYINKVLCSYQQMNVLHIQILVMSEHYHNLR